MEHIENWKPEKTYYQYDKVLYKNNIYMCKVERLCGERPPSESIFWGCYSHFSEQEEKDNITKIGGNHIGNVSGDNVVIYGNNTGNITANGNKSVVVVFGNVTGDITANQVLRLDNSDSEAVKAMFLDKQGKAIKQENYSATNVLREKSFRDEQGVQIFGTMILDKQG